MKETRPYKVSLEIHITNLFLATKAFSFLFKFIKFISFWLCWVFVAARGFL